MKAFSSPIRRARDEGGKETLHVDRCDPILSTWWPDCELNEEGELLFLTLLHDLSWDEVPNTYFHGLVVSLWTTRPEAYVHKGYLYAEADEEYIYYLSLSGTVSETQDLETSLKVSNKFELHSFKAKLCLPRHPIRALANEWTGTVLFLG
jgi:hypothetical protein